MVVKSVFLILFMTCHQHGCVLKLVSRDQCQQFAAVNISKEINSHRIWPQVIHETGMALIAWKGKYKVVMQ
jgi:hypothetical protein